MLFLSMNAMSRYRNWSRSFNILALVVLSSFLASHSSGQSEGNLADEEPSIWDSVPEYAADEEEQRPAEAVEEEAADEEADLDEAFAGAETMQVTANRRTENLQKAALSVTVLSSSFIEDVGLTDFKDIQNFTPNLQIIPQGDSRSTSIRIRGIGSVGNNAGIDPSVGVFIDGVYQGRAGMSVLDLMDIESVEVLRGPQGTLYGKNTAAGALKVSSRRPIYETTAQLETVIGNFDALEVRFTANLPLVEDVIATRLTGYRVTRDGFETNEAPIHDGENINSTTRWGLRSSTLIDVNESVSFLVRADYAEVDEDCCTPDVWKYGDAPGLIPPSLEDLAIQNGITLVPAKKGDRKVTSDQIPKNKVEVGGISVEMEAEQWDHSFTWITAYRSYHSDSKLDADFSELDVLLLQTEVEYDQGSMELRVASPNFTYIDYVGGLYFLYSDLDTLDQLDFRPESFAAFAGQRNTGTNQHRTTSAAAYADTNIHVSELWRDEPNITFTGGVRVGWERKDHEGSQISRGPLGTFETAISGPDSFSNQESSDTYVTGRAILKWEPEIPLEFIGDSMFYVSFATGYKSAGFNQLRTIGGGADERVLFFDPEKSKSYELGARTDWFNRMLTFNITGFFTDYDDFQTQVTDGLGISVINAGNLQTYGFEADITLALVEGWLTVFTAGYTRTEYTDFDKGPCRQVRTSRCIGGFQDLKGERLDNTPLWNLNLFSTYERRLPTAFLPWATGADINWFTTVTYNYESKRYLNASLDPFLIADPTHTVGLRAGLRDVGLGWEVNFWVNNVTDEDVWAIGLDIPTVGGFAAFQLAPRTYGGTVRLKF